MLSIPANARLFLCREPMNMRKSFEGLGSVIEKIFPGELLSGGFFIFLNKSRDHVKVLFWDGDGFVIWYKRLQRGSFSRKWDEETINRRTFFMLLEGIVPQKTRPRFSL